MVGAQIGNMGRECRHIRAWVFGLASVLVFSSASANFQLEHLGLAEGLTQSNVLALAEDHQGYLWIGTEAGISLYDGYQISPLSLPEGTPDYLETRIQGIHSAGAMGMWVATGSGVALISNQGEPRFSSHAEVHPLRPTNKIYAFGEFMLDCHGRWLVVRDRDIFELSISDSEISQRLVFSDLLETPVDSQSLNLSISQSMEAPLLDFDWRTVLALKDQNGGLWISNHQRLWYRACGEDTFRLQAQIEDNDSAGEVLSSTLIEVDGETLLWSTTTGVYQVSSQGSPQKIDIQDSNTHNLKFGPWALSLDSQGRIWALSPTQFGELIRSETPSPATGGNPPWIFHQYFEGPPPEADNELMTLSFEASVSHDQLVWARLNNQYIVVDPNRRTVIKQPNLTGMGAHWTEASRVQPTPRYRDRFGNIWLFGGLNGLSRYVPSRHRFCEVSNQDAAFNSVRALELVEMEGERYLWVSWDGGGLSLWHLKEPCEPNLIEQFQLNAERPTTAQVIRSIEHVEDGVVWLVSGTDLWRGDTRTARLEKVEGYVERGASQHGGLSFSAQLHHDPSSHTLVYAAEHGVQLFSLDDSHYIESARMLSGVTESLAHVNQTVSASSLVQLSTGQLVVTTERGLAIIDPASAKTYFHALVRNDTVEVTGAVRHLAEDSAGVLWVGTRYGLYRLRVSPNGDEMTVLGHWTTMAGLSDDVIYSVFPESERAVWLASNRGLSRLELPATDKDSEHLTHYGLVDGLPTLEFNTAAVSVGSDGYVVLGSIAGLVGFQPTDIQPHPTPPDLVLKDFEVNAASVATGGALGLEFPYDENNFAIHYAGIHFSSGDQNQYAYWLEGLQNEWVNAGEERVARYYGLPAGQYRFWVRASNLDGVWSEPVNLLSATVKPPIWATQIAYFVYALIAIGLMASFLIATARRRAELERLVAERTEDLARQSEVVKKQARALEQALEARTIFFANISHEFRTPLTLIQTAIEKLDPKAQHKEARELASRYLQRLMRLVDQLLDLSKLRLSGAEKASEPWSVNQIAVITVDGFQYLAQEKNIELVFHTQGAYVSEVDQASVEKILLNLVSNAIKYTPEGGRIALFIAGSDSEVCLTIQDNGPGIPREQQESIFDRFERVPSRETMMQEGSGLGLALVREATQAIGGRIQLDSEAGHGCCFTIHFPGWLEDRQTHDHPAHRGYLSGHRLELDQAWLSQVSKEPHNKITAQAPEKTPNMRSILVVEDNSDLRHYLQELLQTDWQVHLATNGIEALAVAEREDIDIVLADIMMPEMDGLELLEHFRKELATSHIPFLILSARHDTETRLLGLTLAADDFLTKPFIPQELQLKLRNVAKSRALLRQAVIREMSLGDASSEPVISTQEHLSATDHQFLKRLESWMAQHFSDESLTVSKMAEGLAVNERTLQRKIAALIDLTPNQFINRYRLSKAREELERSEFTIQQIAFECGFKSQQSFARAFKAHFGITPSEMRQRR